MGPTVVVVFKRLAGMIADRWCNQQYSITMGMIRCQISFSLLHSAIICLRGSRSSFYHPNVSVDVAAYEGRVALV